MQTIPLTADEITAWLRLTETPGIGPVTARRLLTAFGLPEEVFRQSSTSLAQVVGKDLANLIPRSPPNDLEKRAARTAEWAAAADQHFVTLSDPSYPKTLLHLADPPLFLYVKGQLALLHAPAISIVGSRNATPQGLANAEQFAQAFSVQGFTIISGLALGVDGAAHRGALQGPSGTVAVMGTGIDLVYPARHYQLAQQISTNGALVSEWPLGSPACASHFPQRNRIIAALAQAILVIEAAAQSGSLITARLAAEIGREIGAVPGSIHSPLTKGCHQLIKEGAKLVESAQDLLDEINIEQMSLLKIAPRPIKTSLQLANFSSEAKDVGCLQANSEALLSSINNSGTKLKQKKEIPDKPSIASINSRTHAKHTDASKSTVNISLTPAETKVTTSNQESKLSINLPISLTELDANSRHVLEALGYDMATLELLTVRTGLASADLQATLLNLELGGWITTLPGGKVIRQQKFAAL